MKKPIHLKFIENIGKLFIPIIAIFAFYDGLSSSIDFINIQMALWGTLIILVLTLSLFLAQYFRLFRPVSWLSNGEIKESKNIERKFYLYFLAAIFSLWIPIIFQSHTSEEIPKIEVATSTGNKDFESIFIKNDTNQFNILILRFEDYMADENTFCIGRSILEHLNHIQTNEKFPLTLNNFYADTIAPPQA